MDGVRHPQAELRLAFRCSTRLPWLALAPGVVAEIPVDARRTAIPNAPPALVGAINRRGHVFPVFDLGRWLAEPAATDGMLLIEPGPHGAALCIVDEPRTLACQAAGPRHVPLPAALAPFVAHHFDSELGPVLEFDHRRWFASAGAGHPQGQAPRPRAAEES